MSLRINQESAINTSIKNDFQSGVHFHATGTGKSWIAMKLLNEYNSKHKTGNVLWICEKKDILIEQFDKETLKNRNFYNIMKNFIILNFSEKKDKKWYSSVNNIKFWNKPYLLIINRAFLTSDEKYKKIKNKIDFIIHDECHSILNKTTQQFYSYIKIKNPNIKCIGFSATPHLEIKPFDNIISSYSIYDAFKDKIIVPPKIVWYSCKEEISYDEIIICIQKLLNDSTLVYKKIIVWCGMIDLCYKMANIWKDHFKDYSIFIDTSKNECSDFKGYKEFEKLERMGFLFCASKHREGSDIKNLDGCIFLDKVETRCPRLFIQSIGRVLRLDLGNKTYGLVVDIKAKSTNYICSIVNSYLSLKDDIFPWDYKYCKMNINGKLIKKNTLLMVEKHKSEEKLKIKYALKSEYTIDELKNLFKRTLPDNKKYHDRLNHEINMIYSKNLIPYLIQVIHILNITKKLPHVTRGSCGSSLVCYLLGISHIDPVKHNIKFARFLTNYRNNLPDIDLDFPHNLRDEVFLKIELMWPRKIARISNHVYYHDKSALRQAIRNAGIRKFIGKNEINKELMKLPLSTQNKIQDEKKRLEETFRGYSLHCGGIVYYADGVPEDLLLKSGNNNILKQVV
jgi:hypothetical protein